MSRIIEGLMADTCIVTADIGGVLDDVINEDNLQLVEALAGVKRVYSGPCLVTYSTNAPRIVGEAATTVGTYTGILPLTAVNVQPGNALQVLTSQRDRKLVGATFRIVDAPVSTFTVARIFGLERWQRG